MNKNLLIMIGLVIMAVIGYLFIDQLSQHFINDTQQGVKTKLKIKKNGTTPRTIKATKKPIESIKELENQVSLHALEMAEFLQPPSSKELETMWKFSYGCGRLSEDDMESCEFKGLFNARSLDEAKWMRKHGFPHRGMIEQLREESNHETIIELARAGYKPAVTLAALVTSGFGGHTDARRWADELLMLSEATDIYPHRLSGDIEAARDSSSVFALESYLIAEYLGDSEARTLAFAQANGNTYLMRRALERAQLYIWDHFGVQPQDLSVDPRPDGGG